MIKFEEIMANQAEDLCCILTTDLPDYFGLPEANVAFSLYLGNRKYEWDMIYMSKQLNNALSDLIYLERDARAFGFEWPNETVILEQAIDECREIEEAIENKETRKRIQEEVGDLLHTAISLCVFLGFDVEETLLKVNSKFGDRMQAVKTLTQQLKIDTLHGQSFDFMLALWKQAKAMTKEDHPVL